MLVDSHCHLSYEGLCDQIPEVVARAGEAGVTHMLCICSSLSEFEDVTQVADNHLNIYCSVGIHPHQSGKEPEISAEALVKLAEHPKTIGIGENDWNAFPTRIFKIYRVVRGGSWFTSLFGVC